MCELQSKVLPVHQNIFCESVEANFAVETTSRGQIQWNRTWGPLMMQSVKKVGKFGTKGIKSMRKHFSAVSQRTRRLWNVTTPVSQAASTITETGEDILMRKFVEVELREQVITNRKTEKEKHRNDQMEPN